MKNSRAVAKTIDAYIARSAPEIRERLHSIRNVIREAAPDAVEKISYAMPAFALNGPLVYFAAFRSHIGLYPPVKGDAKLEAAVARYANAKGNLRFPSDEPLPLGLIARIVKFRVKQNLAASAAKPTKPSPTKRVSR